MRQKTAQIILAGLIGLIVGALLGGGAVAVVSNVVHRHDGVRYMHPDWQPYPPYPYRMDCGRMRCGYDEPNPYPPPYPFPSKSGIPTPIPTRTG